MEKGIDINFQVAECTLGSGPKSYTMNGGVFPYSRKWALCCFFCMVRGITLLLCHMAVGFVRASWCCSLPLVCHNLFLLPTAPLPSSQMVLFFSCCYKTVFPHETVVKHCVCFLVFHREVKSCKFLTHMALF